MIAPIISSIVSLFILLLYQNSIASGFGDILAAFPIAKEIAFPGSYSPYDLIISSGLKIPFYLYKFAGYLIKMGLNVESIWFCLTLVAVFFIFLLVWKLAYTLTNNSLVATLTTLIIAISSTSLGTLNWSFFPPNTLISSTIALPFALIAVILFYKDKVIQSLIVSAFTYNLHPLGISVFLLSASHLVFSKNYTKRTKLLSLFIGAIVLSPALIQTVTALPSNFQQNLLEQKNTYLYYYNLNAYHAYIQDHFHEGYGWFFINLMGLSIFAKFVDKKIVDKTRWLLIVFLGLALAYAINLYTFKIIPLSLLYLFRVTYLIKPILYTFIVYGCYSLVSRKTKHWLFKLVAVVMILASFKIPHLFIAESLSLSAYLILLSTSDELKEVIVGAIGAVSFAMLTFLQIILYVIVQTQVSYWHVSFSLTIFLFLFFFSHNTSAIKTTKLINGVKSSVAICIVVFLGTVGTRALSCQYSSKCFFALNRWVNFSTLSSSDNQDLIDWVKANTKQQNLFLTPPADEPSTENLFQQFRYVAHRGVYYSYYDVNQLAYDFKSYLETQRRFRLLGYYPIKRHEFDFKSYNGFRLDFLRKLNKEENIDYAIFVNKDSQNELPKVYSNDSYSIIDLSQL